MSGFHGMALPGKIPTSGERISPDDLFTKSSEMKIPSPMASRQMELKIKKVKVEIFDLSDRTQSEKYEKLWKELLVKLSRSEVVVDSCKNLVQRKDGTSYWMKYVEYVEFDTDVDSDRNDKTKGGRDGDGQ